MTKDEIVEAIARKCHGDNWDRLSKKKQRYEVEFFNHLNGATIRAIERIGASIALTAQPSEARDATYVLRQIVNAKEPPRNPQPDDADWEAVALDMKRIAKLALASQPAQGEKGQILGEVEIDYTNYRGERARRRITPWRIVYGADYWHHEAQWLLVAFDHEKQAKRYFAMKNIHAFGCVALPSSTGWKPGCAVIEGDNIVIRFPVAALEDAPHFAWDRYFGQCAEHWKVSDVAIFAKELVRELNRESETGETLITKMLDAACNECGEQGADGVDYRETPLPLPPEEAK